VCEHGAGREFEVRSVIRTGQAGQGRAVFTVLVIIGVITVTIVAVRFGR
jgi:hypothetical protein